jgi:hypothetical protein
MPTALNPGNNSLMNMRKREMEQIKKDLQDIKSLNTKLV